MLLLLASLSLVFGVGSDAALSLPLASFRVADTPETQAQNLLSPAQLINPEEPARTRIPLINADGLASLSAEPEISGWASVGECGNGDAQLQAGGGKRGFITLSNACVLSQATGTRIGQSAVSLRFTLSAAQSFANADTNATHELSAELLAIANDGIEHTIETETYSLTPDNFDWQSKQLLIPATQLLDFADKYTGDTI